MSESLSALLYLVAAVCFIMALRGLSSPDTARAGNLYGIIGMAIAILTTLASPYVGSYWLIAAGLVIGGAIHPSSLIEMAIGLTIGAITFSGSAVAFAKLQGVVSGRPLVFPAQHLINLALGILLIALIVLFVMTEASSVFALLVLLSLAFGFLLIVPIGGADMPVVISMLNSYSGWAACGIGFTLSNSLLIITGALVGSSGAILSYIMCKGMNRSIV